MRNIQFLVYVGEKQPQKPEESESTTTYACGPPTLSKTGVPIVRKRRGVSICHNVPTHEEVMAIKHKKKVRL